MMDALKKVNHSINKIEPNYTLTPFTKRIHFIGAHYYSYCLIKHEINYYCIYLGIYSTRENNGANILRMI